MKRPRSRAAIFSVLVLSALIFAGVFYAWTTATDIFFKPANANDTREVEITIPQNATTADIADELERKGLIRNAFAFRVWARISGLDTKLQAGVYKGLRPSMTISEITELLLKALPDAIGVTIVEGWRLEQIANALEAKKANMEKFDKEKFLGYVKNVDTFPDKGKHPLLQQIPAGQSMEGVLFPDTYYIPVQHTTEDVINMMVAQMEKNIQDKDLEKKAKEHGFTGVYQMLIMASIVERETGATGERPQVAAVYWNRTFEGEDAETVGLIQADPTVQYARDTKNPPEKYWEPLTDAPINIEPDSPYNSYKKKGLPPTPICSPGLASLEATAAPPKTDDYYFFASTDGKTYFSKTLAEHNQKMQEHPVSEG